METIDSLTHLWNRDTALGHVDRLLAQEASLSVALADVDFFINLDSKVGSEEGDHILLRIAGFFSQVEGAQVGRYGGDEFILIFPGRGAEQVMPTVDSVHLRFRKQRFVSESSLYAKVPMTASFGVASRNEYTHNAVQLLKAAEIALAMAKKRGRNRVVLAPAVGIVVSYSECADVSTVVGGQLRGYGGDGGRASDASILEPYGVDVARGRGLYITDRGNHRIRIVKNDGIIDTVAGQGVYGYSGDLGDARQAKFNKPSGVAADDWNQVYIADTGNHCIRKIDGAGIICTWAGCGEEGYSGDEEIAARARLSRPGGVVVDGRGCVYTNDYGNNVIRMITAEGIIRTVAGSGEFGYSGDGGDPRKAAFDRPYGLAVTRDGRLLYVADYGNHCIREVDLLDPTIRTVCGCGEPGYAGDGAEATKAKLNGPFWVDLWEDQYLLVADGENNCIRICDLRTNVIRTLLGGKEPGYVDGESLGEQIRFNIPAGMAVDESGSALYVADYGNNAVRRIALGNAIRWG